MAVIGVLPTREIELLNWSESFSRELNLLAPEVGLDHETAQTYQALHAAFAKAFAVAKNPATNSRAAITAKNEAKKPLEAKARQLAAIIQSHVGTTDAHRNRLGLSVRSETRKSIDVPDLSPNIEVESVSGGTIQLRLRDAENQASRARPKGATAAVILYATGSNPPSITNPALWRFAQFSTKVHTEFHLPIDEPAGSTVWITAMWVNKRSEQGVLSEPIPMEISARLSLAA